MCQKEKGPADQKLRPTIKMTDGLDMILLCQSVSREIRLVNGYYRCPNTMTDSHPWVKSITITICSEKMSRPRGDDDLVVESSNSKLLLIVLVSIQRLLMHQKRLIAMHAIKGS